MWRVPDFLPVCLQDKLRYRKPAVREQGKQVISHLHDQKCRRLSAAFFKEEYYGTLL